MLYTSESCDLCVWNQGELFSGVPQLWSKWGMCSWDPNRPRQFSWALGNCLALNPRLLLSLAAYPKVINALHVTHCMYRCSVSPDWGKLIPVHSELLLTVTHGKSGKSLGHQSFRRKMVGSRNKNIFMRTNSNKIWLKQNMRSSIYPQRNGDTDHNTGRMLYWYQMFSAARR